MDRQAWSKRVLFFIHAHVHQRRKIWSTLAEQSARSWTSLSPPNPSAWVPASDVNMGALVVHHVASVHYGEDQAQCMRMLRGEDMPEDARRLPLESVRVLAAASFFIQLFFRRVVLLEAMAILLEWFSPADLHLLWWRFIYQGAHDPLGPPHGFELHHYPDKLGNMSRLLDDLGVVRLADGREFDISRMISRYGFEGGAMVVGQGYRPFLWDHQLCATVRGQPDGFGAVYAVIGGIVGCFLLLCVEIPPEVAISVLESVSLCDFYVNREAVVPLVRSHAVML